MAHIDLNADLGETVDGVPTADDEAIFAVISSASIACGGHAGDAATMRASVARATRLGVAVGAHPSYPDRAGFGRLPMVMSRENLAASAAAQLAALVDAGADIRYVKPHGGLYHAIREDRAQADAVAAAVAALSERLGRAVPILGLQGEITRAAAGAGLPFLHEAFLDRGYLSSGALVPRGEVGALLHDAADVAARAVRLATDGVVEAVDGTIVEVDAGSLCIHGDSPGAVAMAWAVRAELERAGAQIAPFVEGPGW